MFLSLDSKLIFYQYNRGNMSERISDITGGASAVHSEKISVNKIRSDHTEIFLKAEGFSGKILGLIFFALFWNGFLVVWTTMAASASFLFAAFSIPFWAVGLLMLSGIFTSIFGKQWVEIKRDAILIRKKVLFRTAEQSIPYRDLISIENARQVGGKKTAKLLTSSSADSGLLSKIPTICYDKTALKELMFAEHLSKNDQEWLVNYLNEQITPLLKFVR